MKAEGYLVGQEVTNHKDYASCKAFLNQWLSDDIFSLQNTCYYLDNYKTYEMRFGHGYARPSYAFKFVLKKSKEQSEMAMKTRDYCYHGTAATLVKKILREGLLSPNGSDVKERNGSYFEKKGTYNEKAVYTTKIPEHAQVFADPYEWKGRYFQIFFLVRQDISKVNWAGEVDRGSKYAQVIYNSPCHRMSEIHLLHSKLLAEKEVQWSTRDEKSLSIEAVIVKVHDVHPLEGEFLKISPMIDKLR
jgi:hypothetical protein